MRLRSFFLAIVIFCFLLAGCEYNSLPPHNPQTAYIDEPFLLAASDPVSPSYTFGKEFIFDFTNVPLVRNGTFNDFELTYWTSDSCDRDVWVSNFRYQDWDQIGYFPGPYVGCLMVITQQMNLFSLKGFHAKEYLNSRRQMKVRMKDSFSPEVRALKINPDYFALPLLLRDETGFAYFTGLTHDGESLWLSSNSTDTIYKVSLNGTILKEFVSPAENPQGLAFDGQNLWLVDRNGYIFKMTRNGNVLCQFTVPILYPVGLTWEGNKLWLTEYGCLTCDRIFLIDPDASCNAGSAIITDTFQTPDGGSPPGIAWNGTHLLVVSQSYSETDYLYKITKEGEVVQAYILPVRFPRDIAWDGEAIWVLNLGPKDFWSRNWIITRFKLR